MRPIHLMWISLSRFLYWIYSAVSLYEYICIHNHHLSLLTTCPFQSNYIQTHTNIHLKAHFAFILPLCFLYLLKSVGWTNEKTLIHMMMILWKRKRSSWKLTFFFSFSTPTTTHFTIFHTYCFTPLNSYWHINRIVLKSSRNFLYSTCDELCPSGWTWKCHVIEMERAMHGEI